MPSNWLNLPRQMPLSVWIGSPTSLGLNVLNANGTNNANGLIGASNVLLYQATVTETYRVRRLWWLNGSPVSGNVDVGVFDASGAKLVSTGSTAQSGASTIQSVAVDFTLGVGSYWVGIAGSSATASFASFSFTGSPMIRDGTGIAMHVTVGSAVPLPSQLTLSSNLVYQIPTFGFSRLTSI